MIKGLILVIMALNPHLPEGAELVITGHQFWVKTVAFNTSGDILASAGGDGVIMLWDGKTGKFLASLPGHNDFVAKIQFWPSRNYLISVGHDGYYKIWDIDNLKEVSEVELGHPICSFALTPDASKYAIGFEDGFIAIFNGQTGEQIANFNAHEEAVTDLEFLPDGRLVSVSGDGTAKLWNDSNLVGLVQLEGNDGQSVAVKPDGSQIVVGTGNGFLYFIDPSGFKVVSKLEAHAGSISDLIFTPDGVLISASKDSTIKIWRMEKRSPKFTLRGHFDGVLGLAISPDGKRLASGGADRSVILWDVQNGQELAKHLIHFQWITSLLFDKKSNLLISGSFSDNIRYWDLSNGGLLGKGVVGEIVKLSPSRKYLAIGGSTDSVMIFDFQSGQLLFAIPTPDNMIFCIKFSPDEHLIALSGMLRPIEVYKLPEMTKVFEFQEAKRGYRSIAFWGNDKLIAGGFDGKLVVLDLNTGQKIYEQQAHDKPITNILLTADGSRVFTSDRGGMLKAWSLPNFDLLFSKQAHSHSLSGLALTPENNALISVGLDAVINIWNPNNGNLIKRIDWGHEEGISALAISSDGTLFATGGTDRKIIVWRTDYFLPR